jgi:P27 family predicted phage terminase small subunit
MRGRKPLPTALHVLRGNPSRLRLNRRDEPRPGALGPGVPKDLIDPVARAEWKRIAPGLIVTGQVTTIDRGVLIGFCALWAQWRALADTAAASPFVTTADGAVVPHPAVGLAAKVYALYLRTAAELGATPSARSRVTVTAPPAPASKWAGLK